MIKLGPRNDAAAQEALEAWPGLFLPLFTRFQKYVDIFGGGLQVGGGITDENAKEWLDAGASKVRQLASHIGCLFIIVFS